MHKNPKQGLYSSQINAALQEFNKDSFRTENHNNYEELFVDNKQLDLVKKSDWQVIYGRRGTGKTFLLRMLDKECQEQLSKLKSLSIYITAQDCLASPYGIIVSDKLRALGYFQTFIQLLTERLTSYLDKLIKEETLMEWLGSLFRHRRENIETLILEILDLSKDGGTIDTFRLGNPIETTEEYTSEEDAELGLELDILKPSANLKGGILDKNSRNKSTKVTTTDYAVPRFSKIRQKIVELLELMELNQLIILIDEWTTLDPTASTAIQPEFAELLKRTFAGTPKVSVKIATNRYQTKFSNRAGGTNYRGLEIDADIFPATNLDHVLSTDDERNYFFSNLIYKRLSLHNPKLSAFINPQTEQPDDQFIFSIFRDRRAFEELIKSADGIPRDFLLMFSKINRKAEYSVSETWSAKFIREIILVESISLKPSDIDYKSEADQLLYRCTRNVVKATGGRLFLITHEEHDELENAVDDLLEKRVIHEYPSTRLTEAIRSKYRAYLVQYGLWLDWQNMVSDSDALSKEIFDIPQITDKTSNNFSIDIGLIERENLVCKNCNASFSKAARSFVVRGLCPTCFQQAT